MPWKLRGDVTIQTPVLEMPVLTLIGVSLLIQVPGSQNFHSKGSKLSSRLAYSSICGCTQSPGCSTGESASNVRGVGSGRDCSSLGSMKGRGKKEVNLLSGLASDFMFKEKASAHYLYNWLGKRNAGICVCCCFGLKSILHRTYEILAPGSMKMTLSGNRVPRM